MIQIPKDLRYFFFGSIYSGLSSLIGLLAPLIVLPHIINTIGLTYYGISAVAFTVSIFLSLVVDFGFNISCVNKLSKTKENKSAIISNVIYAKALIFLLLIVLAIISYLILFDSKIEQKVYLTSLIIPLTSVFNMSWALQGLQRIKAWSIIQSIGFLIYVVATFLLINSPDDVLFVNLAYGIGFLFSGFFSIIYLTTRHKVFLSRFKIRAVLEEIRDSYHFFLSNILSYATLFFLGPLTGAIISYEAAGIYSILEKIYQLMRKPLSIYQTLMLPKISGILEFDRFRALSLIRKTYPFVVLLILIQSAVIFFYKEEVITFFTLENVELLNRLLSISFAGIIMTLINSPVALLLMALDKKRTLMILSACGLVLGAVLGAPAIKIYGVTGTVYTLLLIEFFLATTLVFIKKRRYT
jgi:PST family polysaccharide transporter